MSAHALNILNQLVSYYPALIPCIILAYQTSASSLQCWKGTQCVPLPSQKTSTAKNGNDEGANKPPSKVMRIISFVIIMGLIAALYIVPIFLDAPSQATELKVFYLCLLIVPITIGVISTLLSFGGMFQSVLVRKSDGKAAIALRKVKKPNRIIGYGVGIVGTFIAFAALWLNQPLAILIVYWSLLRFFTIHVNNNGRLKFRSLFWLTFVMSVMATVLVVTIVVILLKTVKSGPLDGLPKARSPVVRWKMLINSIICLPIPLMDLSILLRFDYANALPTDFEPPVRRNVVGFKITHKLPTFPRPYFTTAFIVFCCSFVGIAAVFTNDYIMATFEDVAAYVSVFSPPLIMFAVMVQAAMKGQLKELWFYEEDWAAIPTVNLESDDGVLNDTDELEYEEQESGSKSDEGVLKEEIDSVNKETA